MITIAVDAMGGDRGCDITVPAAIELLKQDQEVKLILVGLPEQLNAKLKALHVDWSERLVLHPASQVITMDDLPAQVIRSKRDSSMHQTIELVASGEAKAGISAGNTGALVAISCLKLRTIPGINRPGLIACFPTLNPKRDTKVLDLGATLQQDAAHLVQLAIMGAELIRAEGIKLPKVALLNIGTEEIKGDEAIRQAAKMLSNMPNIIEYAGFIESDAIFKGDVDLVVCGGFVGNIALKTVEGSMYLVSGFIKQLMKTSWIAKISAILAYPLLRRFKQELSPARHNGASLLGLNGVVVKSHGGATTEAFLCALQKAVLAARSEVPAKTRDCIAGAFDILKEQGYDFSH